MSSCHSSPETNHNSSQSSNHVASSIQPNNIHSRQRLLLLPAEDTLIDGNTGNRQQEPKDLLGARQEGNHEPSDAEPSGYESDILDASRIIQYSNMIRQEVYRYYNLRPRTRCKRHKSDSSSNSDNSIVNDDDGSGRGATDLSISNSSAITKNASETLSKRHTEKSPNSDSLQPPKYTITSLLNWHLPLNENIADNNVTSMDSSISCNQSNETSLPGSSSQGGRNAQLGGDSMFADFLRSTGGHYYPLRKRSEKNLHPYTKLVWTDPNELCSARNACRDMSVLEELQSETAGPIMQSQEYIGANFDELEDEDYIPGSPEAAYEESQAITATTNIDMDIELENLQLRSPQTRNGITYKHLASRRRQRLHGPPHKRFRKEHRGDNLTGEQFEQYSNLPSVSSLLRYRDSNRAIGSSHSIQNIDPYDVPLSNNWGSPARSDRMVGNRKQENQPAKHCSNMLSSPVDGPPLIRTISTDSLVISDKEGSDEPDQSILASHSTCQKTLSRGRLEDDSSRLPGSSSAESTSPPTAKTRRLGKLSKHKIRDILPFSFMHDFARDKTGEIEEVGKWRQRPGKLKYRRCVLTSSPSNTESDFGSDDNINSFIPVEDPSAARIHSTESEQPEMVHISDMLSNQRPMSVTNHLNMDGGTHSAAAHSYRFHFNFMDIYEWQYPPLAPAESIGIAPDFLKIVARECRRRGVQTRTLPDDPFKKNIVIAPRSAAELKDGDDTSQSVLLSWRLGIIDIRRVYFCDDDLEESDGLEAEDICNDSGGDRMHVDEWASDAYQTRVLATDAQLSPILVSDDEAIEDNRTYDTLNSTRCYRRSSSINNNSKGRSSSRRKSQQNNRYFNIKKAQREAHSRNPLHSTRPMVQRLGSVMGEFAAFDSDSDKDIPASDLDRPRLPPRGLEQHVSRMSSSKTRQGEFISRFHRQQKPRHSLPSRRHRYHPDFGGSSVSVRQANQKVRHANTEETIFIFDDDQNRGSDRTYKDKLKLRQTKLLPNRTPVTAMASHAGQSSVDNLAERIGRQQTNVHSLGRNANKTAAQVRKWTSIKKWPSRNALQRKAVPTRIKLTHAPEPRIRPTATKVGNRVGLGVYLGNNNDQYESDSSITSRVSFGFNGSTHTLQYLPSGTQFRYEIWITQGGLRQVLKMIYSSLPLSNSSSTTVLARANSTGGDQCGGNDCADNQMAFYSYGGILRIDIAATPAEFIQAYSTLLILWNEIISTGYIDDQDKSPAHLESDIFRWIEFSQQYISVGPWSKPALLSLLCAGLAECIHDSILKLDQMVAKDGYDKALAATVGLSFAIVLLQLALAVAGIHSEQGAAGPRAVGEDDEILSEWTPERFGPKIDECLLVIVKLLSVGAPKSDPFHLGQVEQIWVALLHIFSSGFSNVADKRDHKSGELGEMLVNARYHGVSISSSSLPPEAIVQYSGIWSAVLQICRRESSTEHQHANNLWSAFSFLLPLSQISDEGVAAPRAAPPYHLPLLLLAETAVEKQLSGYLKSNGSQNLRPSDEMSIRQSYFRIHSAVVDLGIRVNPSSPIYIMLYKNLENNKFCSLSIEPLPSLPRFFTRYCGSIKHESSPSDTCTVLWLKALDASLGEWILRLASFPPASKQYRNLLRSVRSAVSKMLPTRILTFDASGSRAQLSTLANYYSVFLFFLHAIPSNVVRSVRLFTQFQSLFKFKESTSSVARRVYFEAWSAAVMIVARHFRQAIEDNGKGGQVIEQLLTKGATSTDIKDYYEAIVMAARCWSESVSVIMDERLASEQASRDNNSSTTWSLADVAFMYLHRVLTSDALANHAPTTLVLILSVLEQPVVLNITTSNTSEDKSLSAIQADLLNRLLEIVQIWQAMVLGETKDKQSSSSVHHADSSISSKEHTGNGGEKTAGYSEDSQPGFSMFNSSDLFDMAAEVEEAERQASFAAANTGILQVVHEKYIPALRMRIISLFSSLSASSKVMQMMLVPSQAQTRSLTTAICILAHMVSACVDAGMRTWESFFEEYGRESLHLVPDRRGRRLVLILFALATVSVLRSKGQSANRLDVAIKDIWFACACDLQLLPYVHKLATALWWADSSYQGSSDCPLAVFANIPVDRRMVNARGVVDDLLSVRGQLASSDEPNNTMNTKEFEDRAVLAISLIDCVLQGIRHSVSQMSVPLHTQQTLASWINRMLSTLKAVHNESEHALYGIADIRSVMNAMAERVFLLIRGSCGKLVESMNISL
ncbi:hypothetical protein GGI25_002798 [Coemansia spiralis]|uniref:Uncharacterized protein n=2 Tax=Coemansia TaxID=4863 RepID=A0A9W8KYN2_9FUNG|nr:hypothetical protein GGI26_003366 [Coemansia sp. RSA 1358]KAJ2677846.1 hypothetical protein GGI25_002798 [Coemansia spiralis]